MTAQELFEKYVQLENWKIDREEYPTYEDFLDACHNHEQECDAVEDALLGMGYYAKFIELDDNGVYNFRLVQLES